MDTFLSLIAADMLSHFSNDMQDVTVVFPGRRAGMFLSREFARLSDKPVWAPCYMTMGDLFQSLTSIQIADRIECICQLYSVMQEVLGAEYTETIDEFWSWGEVLMADFDDIDKHLGGAQAIFTNITERERLGNLDYLDAGQCETLKRFFGHFSPSGSTKLQEEFLRTWEHMFEIYTRLHERLLSDGKLWEGALYRHVIEQMKSDEGMTEKLLEGKRAIVFAGFNVLSDVEQAMMGLIKRENKARFYWDYDIYYVDPKADHEAGYFMKQNLQNFPNAIDEAEAFDNFSQLSDVTFISCTTDSAAARYAGTFINEEFLPTPSSTSGSVEDSSGLTLNDSFAVVLANEALMMPVLHAIPESAREVNVTMGFPASDTPVYGIIMSLLRLQIEGYDSARKRFRHSFIETLKRQPLFELLREEDCLTGYHATTAEQLLEWLLMLVRQIALHYAQIEEPNITQQLYSEAVFRMDRMLQMMLDLTRRKDNPLVIQPRTLRRLLRQMMTSSKIPFHSEPDRGLQVMGMLETRLLDFENVLLLSAEEGNLPRSAYVATFIPESLREAFGLTTRRHRTCIYAYYFYRLIARSRSLTCIYNESNSDGAQHEMSRFLRQMLAETNIPIKTRWLRSEPRPQPNLPIVVSKTPEVMQRLRYRYDQSLEGGEHITLSPSAINAYLDCPMKFYLTNLLRIRPQEDHEESISADIIGNIFHDTASFFYDWLQHRFQTDVITASMLTSPYITEVIGQMLDVSFDASWFHPTSDFDRLPIIRERFQKAKGIRRQNTYRGTELIARDVLLHYLKVLIAYDARHAPFRIVGTEQEHTIRIQTPVFDVKVGGRIDRIDEMGGSRRIVDYKTGSHEPERVKMSGIVGMRPRHEGYYLQILLYALAVMESGESSLPIQPVLFFPIKAGKPDYDPACKVDGAVINDFAEQLADDFKEGLEEILTDIFNPDKPFTCTTEGETCRRCKLGMLCGKGSSQA